MKKQLDDALYDREIERMSNLTGFPHIPSAQLAYRRALRRITETDKEFLHNLITEVVDSAAGCPTPVALIQRADAIRHRAHAPAGNAGCERCGGAGYVTIIRQVNLPGLEPYESEFAAVCTCRGAR